ncbi:hypothetical protein N9937_01000 [bacterium]|nr:hypothetical protein [bacterium]
MNMFNFTILWIVKILAYVGVFVGSIYYIGGWSGTVVSPEKAADNPLAALIITFIPILMGWLLGFSTVSQWKIRSHT